MSLLSALAVQMWSLLNNYKDQVFTIYLAPEHTWGMEESHKEELSLLQENNSNYG